MQVYTSHKIGEEAKHLDYIIEKNGSSVTLYDLDNDPLAVIDDSGDDITVEIAGQELVIGYSEAEQLLALLLVHYEGSMKILETQTVVAI